MGEFGRLLGQAPGTEVGEELGHSLLRGEFKNGPLGPVHLPAHTDCNLLYSETTCNQMDEGKCFPGGSLGSRKPS